MGAEIRRPSLLEVDISGEIVVGGHVVTSAEGEFLI
jgi:predicted PhzF superfamily epimerase YddE/YHI9